MANKTPFEIRLEVLRMAQELFMSNWYANKDKAQTEYQTKFQIAEREGLKFDEELEVPPFPSEVDIIAKAEKLNAFISNTK
jgi:hypothetical protein